MRIKSIRLRNIRSYTDALLEFPEEGSILLSGNIGAGKSSVLLAIDFALFGLQRGELSGNALLRNGASDGEVELAFLVDGKEVVIRRSLKRGSSGVSQDAGSISVNGTAKAATAVELKQDILDLLSYPSELLSKSKSLIFRYTVYTPQEEMKQILLGDGELRLDTLRRVFGIDKYRRIVENSGIVSAYLRERKKELAARASDMPLKQQELAKRESEVLSLAGEQELLGPRIEAAKQAIELKEAEVRAAEDALALVRETRLAHSKCCFEIEQMEQQRRRAESELSRLSPELQVGAVEVFDVSMIGVRIAELEKLIPEAESRSRELADSIQDTKTKMIVSNILIGKISLLDKCPTCHQDVSHDYKKGIVSRENESLAALGSRMGILGKESEENFSMLFRLKQERELAVRRVHEAELARLKLQSLNDRNMLAGSLRVQLADMSQKLAVAVAKRDELARLVTGDHELGLQRAKLECQQLLNSEKQLVARKAALDASVKLVMVSIEFLRAEIAAKKLLSERMQFVSNLRDWVDTSFVNLVSAMERSVMMRVHKEFNDLFSGWFRMLVDSEDFNVRLDDAFTPVIEQNGYDIEYQFLSGGEKTAAALAYRLALNQVTNSIVSTIKTRDLLILDEPTDGFSSEQLDRMRAVLEELKMGQIIIVSHEAKIESMVDKVVRFTKSAQGTVISL